MKKSLKNDDRSCAGSAQGPKQKERHIVSWSQEEDDILRQQIRVHGTENWTLIASKFKDKTTRQCRRRWFTYLNSDFKKGGWSPEEDMLLCEAQKVFGNRWTEIAKVVSGRTDNAVKNRFNTLCKKKAKNEALAQENSASSFINLNNKRVIFSNGLTADARSENVVALKKTRRTCVPCTVDKCCLDEKLAGECGNASNTRRHPFALRAQNFRSCENNFTSQLQDSQMEASTGESLNNKTQGAFLKKDDPKVLALMQQAELLSSLAIKVNSEKTDQSFESAWIVLQDFLKQNKESDLLMSQDSNCDFQLRKFKELVETLTCSNECSPPSWRPPDLYESSPTSSEYSTGSTLVSSALCNKTEEFQAETCILHQDNEHELQSDQLNGQICLIEGSDICEVEFTDQADTLITCDDMKDDGTACEFSITDFTSPVQVTPLFRALAATIPSPKFSESEKHFLMKALGMECTSPSVMTNPQPPLCKRSLLHCL